jgi:hypothetical protein
MNSPDKSTTPPVDPRPGANPGYDDANPRSKEDVPQHLEDARGADFGYLPNPEIGGLNRNPAATPDPTDE